MRPKPMGRESLTPERASCRRTTTQKAWVRRQDAAFLHLSTHILTRILQQNFNTLHRRFHRSGSLKFKQNHHLEHQKFASYQIISAKTLPNFKKTLSNTRKSVKMKAV